MKAQTLETFKILIIYTSFTERKFKLLYQVLKVENKAWALKCLTLKYHGELIYFVFKT